MDEGDVAALTAEVKRCEAQLEIARRRLDQENGRRTGQAVLVRERRRTIENELFTTAPAEIEEAVAQVNICLDAVGQLFVVAVQMAGTVPRLTRIGWRVAPRNRTRFAETQSPERARPEAHDRQDSRQAS